MSKFTNDTGLLSIINRAGFASFQDAINSSACRPLGVGQFLLQTWVSVMALSRNWYCPVQFDDLSQYIGWNNSDILFFVLALVFGCGLTWLRCRITPVIKTWARKSGLKRSTAAKVPESFYKSVMHSFMWFTTAYVVVFSGRYNFFNDPCTVWNDIATAAASSSQITRPWDLSFLYFVQLGYYLHSAVATITMDSTKADTGAMMLHHLITIILISVSYSLYLLHIGVLVMFLHDFSDFVVEFTKLILYFKDRHGRHYRINKILAEVGFLVFMVSWLVFRLYWYPLKVFTASNWCFFLRLGCVNFTIYAVCNILLLLLQILHVYWFKFILVLFIKIVTGNATGVQDTRELDNDEAISDAEIDEDGVSPIQNGGTSLRRSEKGETTHFRGQKDGMRN